MLGNTLRRHGVTSMTTLCHSGKQVRNMVDSENIVLLKVHVFFLRKVSGRNIEL